MKEMVLVLYVFVVVEISRPPSCSDTWIFADRTLLEQVGKFSICQQ
jgi:hypothetical protein